jgi:hypothetical protein
LQRKRAELWAVICAVMATVLVALGLVSVVAPQRGWAELVVSRDPRVQFEPGGGALRIHNDNDTEKMFAAVDAHNWGAPPVVGDRSFRLPGVRWRQLDFAGGQSKWAYSISAAVPFAMAGLLVGFVVWHARRVTLVGVGAAAA